MVIPHALLQKYPNARRPLGSQCAPAPTQATLYTKRGPEPLKLNLFDETPLSAGKLVEFYQRELGRANRLLGDSPTVINSLLVKGDLTDKVQMIYINPPYSIKYASNFQLGTDRGDVKDKPHDPEQIKVQNQKIPSLANLGRKIWYDY